jgi:DNA-binding GntR family transcriptional regulator
MRNSKGTNLKVKAYNQLKKMILLRELKQGEKIFEKDLAEKLGISRTPVREALLILEQEQFVENQDRLGFIVRRPTSKEIEDYFSIREMLEQSAAPLIVANISSEEIDAIESNLASSESYYNSGDAENFILSNGLFQELLFKATHSTLYYRMISNLSDITTLLRAMTQRNQDAMLQSLEGHKEIVRVLKTGDAEAFKKSLEAHLKEFKDEMTRYILV